MSRKPSIDEQLRKALGKPVRPDSQGRMDRVGKLLVQLKAANVPREPALKQTKRMLSAGARPSIAARVLCGAEKGLEGDLADCVVPLKSVSGSRSAAAQEEATVFRTETPKREKKPPKPKAEKKPPREKKPPKAPKEKKPPKAPKEKKPPKAPKEKKPKAEKAPKPKKPPKAEKKAPKAKAAPAVASMSLADMPEAMRKHGAEILAILPTVSGGAATNLNNALRQMAAGDKKRARGSVALAMGAAKRMGNTAAEGKLRSVLDACKECAAGSPSQAAKAPKAAKPKAPKAKPKAKSEAELDAERMEKFRKAIGV